MRERPVRVVGAGVSGLMAAIRLAQRGARVEVIERASDSGARHVPRFDAIENWTARADLTELQSRWAVRLPIHHPERFEIFDNLGRRYVAPVDQPLFYVVRRGQETGSLEQALKAQAIDLGVHIRYGATLSPAEAQIWATGAPSGGRFVASGMTFRTSHPNVVRVLVDRSLAPNAYAYMIVVDGRASLSAVVTRDPKLLRLRLGAALEAFQRIRPFDMRDIRRTGGTGGVLEAFRRPASAQPVLGEAAGLQDYLWGFGIRHALVSGDLVARALAQGLDYWQLVAQEIRPLVESSLLLRRLHDLLGDRGDRALIRRVARSDDPARLLRLTYRAPELLTALRLGARSRLSALAHAR